MRQLSKQSDIQQVYGVFTSSEEVNINEMFSFFSKKKHSPDSSDEGAPIPGPDANIPESSDFIFVERKQDDPVPQNSLYPPVPGMPYPPNPNAAPIGSQHRSQPVNYLDGVPFQLSSQLGQEDTLELVQLEVDGILALMTKRLQFDQADYEFTLEREISAQ